MRIGIIGAMSIEVEALKEKLEDSREETVSGIDFFCGRLCGKDVVIAKCGIGKVFAAICAQTMILRFGVTHIINTGIAGTLTEELDILDVAIADGVVQHDMDTSPIGDPVGLISGINMVTLPTSLKMGEIAEAVANELGIKSRRGIVASGDQFISSSERKDFIKNTFGAVCCEMEGAAIGHTCFVNGVECLVVRAISDSASGHASMEYPKMAALAAEQSQKMTVKLLAAL